MPTIYLSAPHSKTQVGTHRRDFFTILANGIGPDYGIWSTLIGQVVPGMSAVVFDRDRGLRAEGTIVSYAATVKAANGVQRYDLIMRGLTQVTYTNPPKVNYFGVAIH